MVPPARFRVNSTPLIAICLHENILHCWIIACRINLQWSYTIDLYVKVMKHKQGNGKKVSIELRIRIFIWFALLWTRFNLAGFSLKYGLHASDSSGETGGFFGCGGGSTNHPVIPPMFWRKINFCEVGRSPNLWSSHAVIQRTAVRKLEKYLHFNADLETRAYFNYNFFNA